MLNALRQKILVKEGGKIEISSTELPAGVMVEARVGCISEASYTFVFSICSVHDTTFVHPTLATF